MDDERVEEVDFEVGATALHVPNVDWQPVAQYALVLPHLDESQRTDCIQQGSKDLLTILRTAVAKRYMCVSVAFKPEVSKTYQILDRYSSCYHRMYRPGRSQKKLR
jgi:hypothetical protein